FREPQDRRLGGGRCETKRIEAHDHRRVRRDCTPLTRGVPCVGERASADRERVVDPVAELDEERAVAKRAYARIAQDRNGATFTSRPLASWTIADPGGATMTSSWPPVAACIPKMMFRAIVASRSPWLYSAPCALTCVTRAPIREATPIRESTWRRIESISSRGGMSVGIRPNR